MNDICSKTINSTADHPHFWHQPMHHREFNRFSNPSYLKNNFNFPNFMNHGGTNQWVGVDVSKQCANVLKRIDQMMDNDTKK
jgi:hypothetical protein